MPSVYDALGGRLVESLGYEAAYVGGYVTGGSTALTEPMVTMTEQVKLAGDIAQSIAIPLVVDGGAGFGEPLHTMRLVRECIRAGIAGAHIEDQLYPKRAHYHKYVVHGIPKTPVDVYVDGARALDDFQPGTSKGPVALPAGPHKVAIFPADAPDGPARTLETAAPGSPDSPLPVRRRGHRTSRPTLCRR